MFMKKLQITTGTNKKVIGLMNGELSGKIMTKFLSLRPKTYFYITDDGSGDKEAKRTEKKECLSLKTTKTVCKAMKLYYNKDLKAMHIMCLLMKLTRFQ